MIFGSDIVKTLLDDPSLSFIPHLLRAKDSGGSSNLVCNYFFITFYKFIAQGLLITKKLET